MAVWGPEWLHTDRRSNKVEYEIRVADRLDDHWRTTFDGMRLRRDPGDRGTTLRGPVMDQAALHGLLAQVRDLGLTLLSVRRVDDSDAPA